MLRLATWNCCADLSNLIGLVDTCLRYQYSEGGNSLADINCYFNMFSVGYLYFQDSIISHRFIEVIQQRSSTKKRWNIKIKTDR